MEIKRTNLATNSIESFFTELDFLCKSRDPTFKIDLNIEKQYNDTYNSFLSGCLVRSFYPRGRFDLPVYSLVGKAHTETESLINLRNLLKGRVLVHRLPAKNKWFGLVEFSPSIQVVV